MPVDIAKAYGQVQKSALSGRAAEAEAFAKSAANLHEAASGLIEAEAYKEALKKNQKLWTLIQASLSEDKDRLPEDLKRNILKLSIFVDKQTLKALAAPSYGNVESLININRQMASGQFQKSGK